MYRIATRQNLLLIVLAYSIGGCSAQSPSQATSWATLKNNWAGWERELASLEHIRLIQFRYYDISDLGEPKREEGQLEYMKSGNHGIFESASAGLTKRKLYNPAYVAEISKRGDQPWDLESLTLLQGSSNDRDENILALFDTMIPSATYFLGRDVVCNCVPAVELEPTNAKYMHHVVFSGPDVLVQSSNRIVSAELWTGKTDPHLPHKLEIVYANGDKRIMNFLDWISKDRILVHSSFTSFAPLDPKGTKGPVARIDYEILTIPDDFSRQKCCLTYYGLPEPNIPKKSLAGWITGGILCFVGILMFWRFASRR